MATRPTAIRTLAAALVVACAAPAGASTFVYWDVDRDRNEAADAAITPAEAADADTHHVIDASLGTIVSLGATLSGTDIFDAVDPDALTGRVNGSDPVETTPWVVRAVAAGDAPMQIGLTTLLDPSVNLAYLLDETLQPPDAGTQTSRSAVATTR